MLDAFSKFPVAFFDLKPEIYKAHPAPICRR